MEKRSIISLLCVLGLLHVFVLTENCSAETGAYISQNTPAQGHPDSARHEQQIPLYSVHQYRPCPDQNQSLQAVSNSFTAGHLPSKSEIRGPWVLIGIWDNKDSRPDLNCTGIMRGEILEWVMFGQGDSLMVNMASTLLKSDLEPDGRGALMLLLDLQGDNNPTLRCRVTRRGTLVCLGSPYYVGAEFKRMGVNCVPSISSVATPNETQICSPSKVQAKPSDF
jgi:hypothetical protein